MNQQNYFTWRKSVGEIAQQMYGVPAGEIDSLNSQMVQNHYFKDELSPEEAAERLFHGQIPDR